MLPDKHPTQVDGFDHHKHRVSNQSLHLTLHPQHHTPQDIFQSSCLQSISVNTPPRPKTCGRGQRLPLPPGKAGAPVAPPALKDEWGPGAHAPYSLCLTKGQGHSR